MIPNDSLPQEVYDLFKCQRCGNCCSGPGFVYISTKEAQAMADLLQMNIYDFTEKYTRIAKDRKGLVLKDRSDGACIFLSEDGDSCLVQDAKPVQCQSYPWDWQTPNLASTCFGIQMALLEIQEKNKPCKKIKLEGVL